MVTATKAAQEQLQAEVLALNLTHFLQIVAAVQLS